MNRGDEEYDQDGDYAVSGMEDFGETQLDSQESGDDDSNAEYSYPEEEGDYSNYYNEYGDEDAEEDAEEEEREDTEAVGRGPGGRPDRWVSSLQELLGTLAQGLEARRAGEDGGARRVNLAEVFPEYRQMFGMGGGARGEHGRMQTLVANVVAAAEDPYVAAESLREINEQLLMLNPLAAERVVPQGELLLAIIDVLRDERLQGELQLQLIACRCLYNMFEMNPEMVSSAVEKDVIPTLRKKLAEISYIDLAEQVLETLEYISRLLGKEILESGSLVECLQYVDFFTVHAQRKATTIVANSCARAKACDFKNIEAFFPLLKGVLVNNKDQVILTKMLNALYSICGALGASSRAELESLIDLEIIRRVVGVVSSSDIDLDGKLRSIDILSQLATTSPKIRKQIIDSCDLSSMLWGCFSEYKKNSTSSLHETLMFVPKQLLASISRFLALLLPIEEEQVLSIDHRDDPQAVAISEEYITLVGQLMPFLIEIYLNTVDFDIRRYILISLARIASIMSSNSSYVDKQLIGLLSSSITQNKSAYEQDKGDKLVTGGLLIGLLSVSTIMIAKCSQNVLPALRREGTFEILRSLYSYLQQTHDPKGIDEGSEPFDISEDPDDGDDVTHSTSGISSDEDDYDMEFGEVDVPDQVKPKKIKFAVFRPLTTQYVEKKLWQLCQTLVEGLSSNDESVINELREIEELVSFLHSVDRSEDSPEYWTRTWTAVRDMIFRDNFTISGFEFISTGLSDGICRLIKLHPSKSSSCRTAFIQVFSDRLELLVKTLQSALTKLESFEIIDCGTTESRAASLGKQMKLKLEYIGDLKKDNIPPMMSSLMVNIHCISSYKTLNEFLKHRVAQSRFLNSILPLSNSIAASDDVKTMNFQFQAGDEIISSSETIFGSIFKYMSNAKRSPTQIWSEVQVIKYKRVYEENDDPDITRLYPEHVFDSEELKPIDGILDLLSCCYNIVEDSSLFVNPKLTVKLSRQLEEPLIVASGALPRWALHITRHYFFLFPLDVRMFFLQNTSFGYGRLIQLWKERTENEKYSSSDDQLQQLGRPTRHKLRISRENMFLSALKILSKYGSSPSVLEIEYQDEVGIGMGPTLEFYASVSKEFARKSLGMWHGSSVPGDDFLDGLLFPAPLSPKRNGAKIYELFTHLGTFVARSMLDNRILDFRFNRVFFDLMHTAARREELDFAHPAKLLESLRLIDPQLAKSLAFVREPRNWPDLESMALSFTVPGYDFDLVEGGANTPVTAANAELYVARVLDAFLGSGVRQQLRAFMEGFSRAFPYSSLLVLTPDELSELYGRVEEDWSVETLYSYITADHGYSMDSPTLHDLIAVMAAFDQHHRRLFLQFLTGSPKLPVGGFKNLKPHLTVVLKHPEGDLSPDQYLPSVMTCANYLKLPKYSSREVLRARIVHAIHEGSGAFLLS
ncbi:ABR013Wp [Eremothecium gossypii ATCC 10895]|uniref:HECT-type E3 ubiquitin transferase n=1 Tax=Eremothecium gossypii (strain ATCC 10895 / CBS 109.51 / FGSC 9923 / NRRL Y-1056) TaxID=284811 RepID=Q75DK8_EREGS|nr:ABR013Wp [Eremothecium gossypii ATCC 10895]AAS50783.2 ABR013Wp [Eremothecium gossypii ATCC 10895]AEY95072.1 FABR013Wp [Eremothecium gossypii FDAG1]